MTNEVIIKDTHRGLWYEDGVLKQVLEAGRYEIPATTSVVGNKPKVELVIIEVRERDLTIIGQDIQTRPEAPQREAEAKARAQKLAADAERQRNAFRRWRM
jgi:hypothetical protein